MPVTSNKGKRSTATVALEQEVYDAWKAEAKSKKQAVAPYINDILKMELGKREMAHKMSPSLSLEAMGTTSLFIRDAKLNMNAGIILNEGNKLFCDVCDKHDCPHIEFAKMLPELGHLNLIRTKK